jgi:hypothetical protein
MWIIIGFIVGILLIKSAGGLIVNILSWIIAIGAAVVLTLALCGVNVL